MGSTPSSLSPDKWYVRLVGEAGEPSAISELFNLAQVPREVEICQEGCVVEDGAYKLVMFGDVADAVERASVSIDGTDYELDVETPETPSTSCAEPLCRAGMMSCVLSPISDSGIFELSYALVRLEVTLLLRDGQEVVLGSLDIPCLAKNPARGKNADAMLRDLVDGSDTVLNWMFSTGDRSEDLWGAAGHGGAAPGTAAARIEAATSTLDVFESCLPVVRAQAASRVVWEDKVVPACEARRCGREEALWMACNPGCLKADLSGPVCLPDGRRFTPSELMVRTARRSADTYENGVLLGFLAYVTSDLSLLASRLRQQFAKLDSVVARLEGMGARGSSLPALTAARLGFERVHALSLEADALAQRARGLKAAYSCAMPGVAAVESANRSWRRTRLFCESATYARLWTAMSRWSDFCPQLGCDGRDGLVLQAVRLNTLFELYCLHRMLRWLYDAGFRLASDEGAIQKSSYSFVSRRGGAADAVADLYCLTRGDERVTVWYQPVFHGGNDEEMGVHLHRTTLPLYADGTPKRVYPYYTPDYLIEISTPGGVRSVVLDAKFSNPVSLLRARDNDRSDDGECISIFKQCCEKYLLATCDSRTGKAPDAVWLLCCGEDGYMWRYQRSPWAQARAGFVFSGIAAVSPGVRSLDALFAELGLRARRSVERGDAE